jgi:cold shock protein
VGRVLPFWSSHSPLAAKCPFPNESCLGRAWAHRWVLINAQRERFLTMRISGTVKFFNSAKGFGFIAPEDGSKDVFVHATALEAAGIRSLNEGDKVSFMLEDDRKGRGKQAGQIQKS